MARKNRKRRKSSGMLGALVIEGLAVVVFIFLFSQARAERQQESELERSELPAIHEILEQTPLQGLLSPLPGNRNLLGPF